MGMPVDSLSSPVNTASLAVNPAVNPTVNSASLVPPPALETVMSFPPQCSVEISRNAKGETSWSVKSYAHTSGEALDEVLATYDRLAQAKTAGKL